MNFRVDKDTIGDVAVPEKALWMAQTQRSVENFPFGVEERMPTEVLRALTHVKEACAFVNKTEQKLDPKIADAIIHACKYLRGEVECNDENSTDSAQPAAGGAAKHAPPAPAAGQSSKHQFEDHFPLVVFQTGSGTQSNMNMNEVIATLANQELAHVCANRAECSCRMPYGVKSPVHPNDHVNKGQSSNDVFPTASHVAIVSEVEQSLLPALQGMCELLRSKVESDAFKKTVKVGRTHMMDAVPLTLAQELTAHLTNFTNIQKTIESSGLSLLREVAIGGTAVGTGLNSYPGFDEKVCKCLTTLTKTKIVPNPNKFTALSTITPVVNLAGNLSTLATVMSKFANDIRVLSSGPRCGLGELILPENEPGSSIMPGKVNPTQCESMAMVAVQILGCCHTVTLCNLYGHLQLNVYYPVATANILRSVRLASKSLRIFGERCLAAMAPNFDRIKMHLNNSLMLATALNTVIGYDKVASVAKNAHENNLTLKESVLALKVLTEKEFDEAVNPQKMV